MSRKNYLLSVLIFSLLTTFTVSAQPKINYNAASLHEDIERLNVLGSVLYLAAHPDDENTRLITYFTKEKKYNTAYLSLTRGGGGQNLIGTELNEQLGVIRTQELLAARSIDGGKQFFSRAKDFGFSKTPDETFEVWNKEKVLADVVWVIRKFRPDVIVTRFNTEPGRTHGHHTASAILASEAFDAAADPSRFPEQLKYVEVWQPKRLVWNTNTWFYSDPSQFKADSMLTIDVGAYNEVLGKSYSEIAAESRSMHKSQGFGASGSRGSSLEYLEHMKGPKANKDLFEDINVSWSRIEGGDKVGQKLQEVLNKFTPDKPEASLDGLMEARMLLNALPGSYWKNVKLQELDVVIKGILGIWTEVVAADFSAVPGEQIKVTIEAINRSSIPVELKAIQFSSSIADTTLSLELKENINHTFATTIKIPETATYSSPYWLREEQEVGMFNVNDQVLIGTPENAPAVMVTFSMNVKGQEIQFTTPLVYKKTDPVKGEQYRPFEIIPPVFVNLSEDLIIFADNKPKVLSFSVRSAKNKVEGIMKVEAPKGWRVEPAELPLSITGEGVEINYQVKVYPSATPTSEAIKLYAVVNSDTFNQGMVSINYDHIPAQILLPKSKVKVNRLDLKKKGNAIGYIMGAGDEIPSALEEVGYKVSILNEKAITQEALNKFDAIVIGIRAFNTNQDLKRIQPMLFRYVKNGGTVVVQYNTVPFRFTAGAYVTDSIGPYPLKLSRDRVTKEDAAVTILDPKHPLLNKPNKINQNDFDNWVQERGLYFPDEWSNEYQPIIAINDPGEDPKKGSILYAEYGKGVFIYTGISFFRQLPAGVPGAYRLFVNLISAGQ